MVTLIGGPHASFVAADLIEEAPWIDVVVMGEGDQTVVELVKALEDGSDLARSPALPSGGTAGRWSTRPGRSSRTWTACPCRPGTCCPYPSTGP